MLGKEDVFFLPFLLGETVTAFRGELLLNSGRVVCINNWKNGPIPNGPSGDLVAIGLDVFPIFFGFISYWSIYIYTHMGVSINSRYPKMDGENHGKPYEQMDDLGGKTTPIFGLTPI